MKRSPINPRPAVFVIAVALALLTAVTSSATDPQPSPYAGLEERPIKALSADEIAQLEAGQGMGLAMPAELNGYPGPKHVLELADALHLTPEQRVATQQAFDSMLEQATALGARVIAAERELDQLFGNGAASPTTLRPAVEQVARLRGELRYAHLEAHLTTLAILRPEQREHYGALRGYGGHGSGHEGGHDPSRHH